MKPRVYVETTVVSYLTARPARDVVVAGHQRTTIDWWETAPDRFHLVVSELVREEAGLGDPDAAAARLSVLAPLASLRSSAEAERLTKSLIDTAALPEHPRRRPHRYRRSQRRGLSCHLELSAPRERSRTPPDRVRLSPRGSARAGSMHARGVDGGLHE